MTSLILNNSSALSKFCILFLKISPWKLTSERFIKCGVIMGFESDLVTGAMGTNQPLMFLAGPHSAA